MQFRSGLSPKFVRRAKFTKWNFQEGKPLKNLKQPEIVSQLELKSRFLPDEQIFTDTREFKFDLLAKRLRELAFLNPGVKIICWKTKTNEAKISFRERN